jgi:hypothetical protein
MTGWRAYNSATVIIANSHGGLVGAVEDELRRVNS